VNLQHTVGAALTTPERIQKALAKYGVEDQMVNRVVRTTRDGSVPLESVYLDVEVR
jgi:hypothetical protein